MVRLLDQFPGAIVVSASNGLGVVSLKHVLSDLFEGKSVIAYALSISGI